MTTYYYSTCFIHDVMHDVIAHVCCTHAQWCLDHVLCSVELIMDCCSLFRVCCFSDVTVDTSASSH